jgi:O-antigen/teichoic acid export membrane protein
MLVYLLALVGSILVARALGPDGRGQYYLPVAAAATVVVVMHLSVEVANTYLRAERQTPLGDLAQTLSMLAVLLAPPAIALMLVVYELERNGLFAGVERGAFVVVALTVPMSIHLLWMANLFLLDKRLPQSQLAMLVGAVIQFVGIVVLAAIHRLDVTTVLVLYGVSVVVPWALHVRWARAFVLVHPAWDWLLMRSVLTTGLRLHVGILFAFLLLRADIFLVGSQLGAEDAGVYSLAVLYAEMIWLLVNPLVISVLPFQTEASREDAGRLSFKAARFNLMLGGSVAVAFAATCWFVFPVVYGAGFGRSYGALVALLPGVLAMTISRPLANWLIRQGQPVRFSAIAVAAFAVNIGCNLVLLPRIGLIGASVASSIAYTMLAVLYLAWALHISGLGVREALWPQRGDWETFRRALVRLRPA